jgi:hypothetical protein
MRFTRRNLLRMGAVAATSAAGGIFLPGGRAAGEISNDYFRYLEAAADGRRVIEDPPDRIVEHGLIRCGLFKTPVRTMNLLESNALGGRAKTRLGLPRLMEWIGAGMAHPDWYFGFIIVNAQAASLAVLYGYSRKTGDYFSHDSLGPKSWVRVAESTWNDVTAIHKRGYNMEVNHRLEQGFHKVKINIRAKPGIIADLTWHEDLEKLKPLVSMAPVKDGGFMYNHKAQMPIEGTMKIGDEDIEFDPRRDLANMDDLKTFGGSNLKLNYNWFNFGGFDERGRVIGLNASASDQKPDPNWSENCIWAGDKLFLVGPVSFELEAKDVMKSWHCTDRNGKVDITFHPEGGKTVALPPLAKYHQKCGTFRGTLIDGSGERHEVKDYYGCAEYADVF